jgi:two-component system, cell cycle response regulator
MTADLAPLRPRLGALFILRLCLAGTALGAGTYLLAGEHPRLATAVAAYLVISVLVEVIRQWRETISTAVIGAGVLLDGLFLAAAVTVTGGLGGSLTFLLYVHLVAVTLLASYRTGLKLAVWQCLLLVVANSLPPAVTGVPPLSTSTAVFAVVSFLAVALATALFSSLNERELRRSRAGFQVLAEMANAMEEAPTPADVASTLLRSVPPYLGTDRGAVYLSAEQTVTSLSSDRLATLQEVSAPDAVVEEAWRTRRPVLVKRLDPARNPALSTALPDGRNLIVLPMGADGAPSGALVVERGGSSSLRINASVVAMLGQLAAHAALAHRNVRLLAEVKHLATIDGLTGLANRRTFESALNREVARAVRSGDPLSLLLVDIDHFKRVNDDHGHQMGDDVLRHVGQVLATQGRELDLPARYGGEEFAVLLPGCPAEEAVTVAERLRAGIAAEGSPLPVTASIGLAAIHRNAVDGEGLVKAADEALYAAKEAGRDRTVAAKTRRLRSVGAA